MHRLTTLLVLSLATAALIASPSFADDKKKDTPKTGVKKELSDDEKARVLDMLEATTASFEDDGTLEVTYQFEQVTESLANDWAPSFSKSKGRCRFTQGYEGSAEGTSGVLISQRGSWTHEVRWLGQVEMIVELMPMSTCRKQDAVVAVYRDKKGRHIVGSNGGARCVKMKGTKIVGSFPGSELSFRYNTRTRFGLRVKNGVLEAIRSGTVESDTSKKKSFLKKLPAGHVGLIWNTQMNGIISNITIKGTVDPEWVQEQTGKKGRK